MTADREYWRDVYRRFDPEDAPEQRAWRVERKYSPAAIIAAKLRGGLAEPRVVLVGTRGTGKTTELYRVADEVGPDRIALYLDVHRHLQDRVADSAAIDLLKPWEVMALIGLATVRVGTEFFGSPAIRDEVQRFEAALRRLYPEEAPAAVDVAKLAGGLLVGVAGAVTGALGTGLHLLAPLAAAADWRIPIGRRTQPADEQDARVRELVDSINHLIQGLHRNGRRSVLLLDGLDRVTREDTAADLFVRSSLFSQLGFNATILVGPVCLRRRGLLGALRGFAAQVVHEVPVLDPANPSEPGAGVAFFEEVWERRTHDLTGPGLPSEVVRRAAYYSGGRTRTFQRIIRELAEGAYAGQAVNTADAIDGVLQQLRLEIEEGVTRADVDVLRGVMEDPRRLPGDVERVADLLDRYLLYPYPNQSTWYYPNPLLLLGPLLGRVGFDGSST